MRRRYAARAALCTLAAAAFLLSAHALPPPFVHSSLYSVGKVRALPASPVLDVSEPSAVDAVTRTLVYNNELLFFQFETTRARWAEFAVNMVAQVTNAGYHHYLALGAFEEDCVYLHAAAARLRLSPVNCATSSKPAHGTPNEVNHHGMWASRYAFLAELLTRHIHVLLFDADYALHKDIYAALYAPCMRTATLVANAEGGGPNGGFMYVRGAHPRGAAHWLLSAVAQRYELFEAGFNATGRLPVRSNMDQDILKYTVHVATAANGSHWDMGDNADAGNPFWAQIGHPQTGAAAAHDIVEVDITETCAHENSPTHMTRLFKPLDAPGALADAALPDEYLIWAPPWVISR